MSGAGAARLLARLSRAERWVYREVESLRQRIREDARRLREREGLHVDLARLTFEELVQLEALTAKVYGLSWREAKERGLLNTAPRSSGLTATAGDRPMPTETTEPEPLGPLAPI